MTIRRFILISVLLHAAIIIALIFISKYMKPPKLPQSQLMADLVSPDQIKPLPPVPARPKKPRPAPKRITPPAYSIPKLPPPTKEQLKEMPISGAPRPKPLAGPRPQKAPAAAKPAGSGKPSGKPGYEANNRHSSGHKSHSGFNPILALNEAAIREAYNSEKKRSESKSSIGFSTREFKYYGYMQLLKQKIEDVWIYPQRAIAQRLQGDLDITFVINKDGTLREVTITRTSGYPILDDAAVKAIKDGVPYWPLPDAWHMDSLTIHGTFQYVYGGMFREIR